MKRKDFLIIFTVLLLAGTAFLCRSLATDKKAATVVVTQSEEEIYSGSLYQNKTISLKGNTIEIKAGKVKVTHADCKNQICVKHSAVSKYGESIICLPNKVIVEIK